MPALRPGWQSLRTTSRRRFPTQPGVFVQQLWHASHGNSVPLGAAMSCMQRDVVSNMRRPTARVPGDTGPPVRVAVGNSAAADAGPARIVTPFQDVSTRRSEGAAGAPAAEQPGSGAVALPSDTPNTVTLADHQLQGRAAAVSRCCGACRPPPPSCLSGCHSGLACTLPAPATVPLLVELSVRGQLRKHRSS